MSPNKKALIKAHPEEPWLWKKDWAEGVVRVSAATLAWPLFFAVVWTTFCIPMWHALLTGKSHNNEAVWLWWFTVAFSLVGLFLTARAVFTLFRWYKYGRSVFKMASVPGVVGGRLAGVILIPGKVEAEEYFRVTLSCLNVVTTRGSESRVSRRLVWQDEQIIARDMLTHGFDHSAVPVLFQIPYDCRQTDDNNCNDMIQWRLEITAKTPGLDYCAEFDVPVFKTPASDPNFVVDTSLIAKYVAPENPERDLREAGVLETLSPTGKSRLFVFPMARHPGAAAGFTLGTMFSFGSPFLWIYLDFELLAIPFAIVFGLVGIVLLLAALELWLYRSTVDVSTRGISVRGGLCGGFSRRWIEFDDIIDIETASHMKSEKVIYYDIVVVCRGGKRITAGKWIPGKRRTAAVIRQIERALGVFPD